RRQFGVQHGDPHRLSGQILEPSCFGSVRGRLASSAAFERDHLKPTAALYVAKCLDLPVERWDKPTSETALTGDRRVSGPYDARCGSIADDDPINRAPPEQLWPVAEQREDEVVRGVRHCVAGRCGPLVVIKPRPGVVIDDDRRVVDDPPSMPPRPQT